MTIRVNPNLENLPFLQVDHTAPAEPPRITIGPSVGRKVWYRPSEHDLIGVGAMNAVKGQPLDATVLAVWGDRCVNVLVHDSYGKPFTKTSCTLVQDGDKPPMHGPKDDFGNPTPGGYVEWMPYQKEQAAKAA